MSWRPLSGDAHLARVTATIVLLLTASTAARAASDRVVWDAPMRIPAPERTSAWFPDLVVDHTQRVHVVWSDTDHWGIRLAGPRSSDAEPKRFESFYYTIWDGDQWTPAHLIAPPQTPICRGALAIDERDTLHLLFRYSPSTGYDLYYRQAPADDGLTEGGWQGARLINTRWNTYMGDIATSGDIVHIVYDDSGPQAYTCPTCRDIHYRRSTDTGLTWSEPVELMPNSTSSSRAQIKTDSRGVVYVVWDEEGDRALGDPDHGVLLVSGDDGQTWSPPTIVSDPSANLAQLAVGADGHGGVLLVWRTRSARQPWIYYMWSSDEGQSWSAAQPIPGVVARQWDTPFDAYDIATDSSGHLHLLATGFTQAKAPLADAGPPQLLHLEWNGGGWSAPTVVYAGAWYPERPQLFLARGNQLHVTWFVRLEPSDESVPHQIWYARGVCSAPETASPLLTTSRGSWVDTAPMAVSRDTRPAPNELSTPLTSSLGTRWVLLLLCMFVGAAIVALVERIASFRDRRRTLRASSS